MKNIIYGLKDPRNDVYQYIGKSTVGNKRALKHLTESHNTKVNEWVETLNADWLYPIVEIIEEVEDINELSMREEHWIGYYYDINPNLFNIKLIPSNINPLRTDEDEDEFNQLRSLLHRLPTILKNERVYRKLTQKEMADKVGVSRSTLSLCENGRNVNIDTIKQYLLTLKGIDLVTKERGGIRVRK
tara:strand:+ start:705 stop:1265 length:561 start_codon:yes stop_codon:yes gene_type:complete